MPLDLDAVIPASYFKAAFAASDDSLGAYLDRPDGITIRKWRSVARRDGYLGLHRIEMRESPGPGSMQIETFLDAFAMSPGQLTELARAGIVDIVSGSEVSMESVRRFTELLMTRRLIVATTPTPALFESHGLGQFGGSILEVARPAVRLISSAKPTNSRLGGIPDLDGRPWPRYNEKPLSFVAQLDLAELAGLRLHTGLPQTGLLSFFCTNQWGSAPGYDPNSRSGWQVYWMTGSTRATEPPEELEPFDRFEQVNVAFRSMLTLPSWFSDAIDEFGLSEEERDRYNELWWEVTGNQPHHWLGGYPDLIQGDDVYNMCQLASNGINAGDSSGYDVGRARGLLPPTEWELLFQVWNDDQTGMMWADSGCLYYCIRQQDLADRAFDRTWCVEESL